MRVGSAAQNRNLANSDITIKTSSVPGHEVGNRLSWKGGSAAHHWQCIQLCIIITISRLTFTQSYD